MDRPAFVVGASRNMILQVAWAAHLAAQKAEGKAPKKVKAPAEVPVPVKKAGKKSKAKP